MRFYHHSLKVFGYQVPKLRREDEAKCGVNCIKDYLFAKASCAGYHQLRLYLQKRAVRAITNSDFICKSELCGLSPSQTLLLKATCAALVLEQPVIIERICAVQISRNLQFLHHGPKSWNSLPVSVTRSSNLLS